MKNFLHNLRGRVDTTSPAKTWTWLKVGGKPIFTFFPLDEKDLQTFLKEKPTDLEFRTFGAGSNILIRDHDHELAFIRLTKHFNQVIIKENEMIVQGGASTRMIVQDALKHNFGNLSFMYTIPGVLGGLIKMNAGAYNQEMKDVVNWVEIMDENGEIHQLKNHE
jgi:UDP-N-acetylmuramate dehydrogenase